MTTLLVTHDQAEALSFADQIAIMRSGLLAQVGNPRQVYDDPVDLPTAEFIGEACVIPVVVHGDVASGALGDVVIRRPPGVLGVRRSGAVDAASGTTAGAPGDRLRSAV